MKTKIVIIFLLVFMAIITGCMRPNDVLCNYDGVCDENETNDCPDCEDVLGRGVPLPPSAPPSIDKITG